MVLVLPGEEYPNYDSMSYIKTDGGPFYTFNNFYLDNASDVQIDLKGSWILIPKGYQYHHFLKEIFGTYLYYKNNVDRDINVLWVEQPIDSPTGHNLELVNNELSSSIKPDKIHKIQISDIVTKNIKIEKLIIFSCNTRYFFSLESPNLFIKNYTFNNLGYYHFPEVNKELRKFFEMYMHEDIRKPKKIFITRRDANNAIRKNNRLKDFDNRYMDEWLDDTLENFFSSRGFEIVTLSGMSIKDQISYFYNADVIAGVRGGNLCNTICSKDGTALMQININKLYSYPWEKEFDSVVGLNYMDLHLYEDISAETVENALLKEYDEFLKKYDLGVK
jgi:hypothetical protein